MGLLETEALVLKSYSLSDADKIVVFLTIDHGLVRGVAKGAKRLKSHFGSALEPFTVVSLTYFQKDQQELVSIRHCEVKQSYFDLASDPLFLQKLAYMAELLSEFAPPGEPNPRLFNMTKICLGIEVADASALDVVLLYFELWLLKLGGYLPVWERCDDCGDTIEEEDRAWLQSNYQLLCKHCSKAGVGPGVGYDERLVYAEAQRVGPQKFIEFAKDKEDAVATVSTILKRIIAGIIGKDWHEERILSAIYK